MTLIVVLDTDPPVTIIGDSLSGAHRPLNGEVSSSEVTANNARGCYDLHLKTPPLGCGATIAIDGEEVMIGYLYRVDWTPTDITLGIEG